MNIHICKITSSREERSSKARNCTYYLDRIQDFGFEFDKLEAYCTDGDIRPPYPYQWLATTKKKNKKCDDCFRRVAIVKCPNCGYKACKQCMDMQEGLCWTCAPSMVDI